MKRLISNVAISITTIIILLAFLELVVFKYVIVSKKPIPTNVNGISKYKPNQKGFYRKSEEVAANYQINENGWNSRYVKYSLNKPKDKTRIAIIGDSFVEAFQVDFDESLAEQLEDMLGRDKYEVYRFGMSGNNIFEHYNLLKGEVTAYKPDIVVILLIHNDFQDVISDAPDKPFVASLNVTGANHIQVVPHFSGVSFRSKLMYFLMRFNIGRYFIYEKQIIHILNLSNANKKRALKAGVDMRIVRKGNSKIRAAANYSLTKIKEQCDKNNIKLFLMMNGYTDIIYTGEDSSHSYADDALSLNQMARELTDDLNISFLDLHPVFEDDYKRHGMKFDFLSDPHWNKHGHSVAARVIYKHMTGQTK